ncbi:unnamed protein product, partial [Gulo gulo]
MDGIQQVSPDEGRRAPDVLDLGLPAIPPWEDTGPIPYSLC